MYGDTPHKLALHAKRTLALPTLPPYAADLVRQTVREVSELDRDAAALLAPFAGSGFDPSADRGAACALLIDHLSMRRAKRCLLAYHRVRAQRLESMCWEGTDGAVVGELEQDAGGGHGPGNLSPEEEEYVRRYAELLAGVKGRWADIDLTGSLEPPRELFVDVRVLKDSGEVQTEYGYVCRRRF